MTDIVEMDPNLVGPSGEEPAGNIGDIAFVETLNHMISVSLVNFPLGEWGLL